MRLTTIWEQSGALSDFHIPVLNILLDGRSLTDVTERSRQTSSERKNRNTSFIAMLYASYLNVWSHVEDKLRTLTGLRLVRWKRSRRSDSSHWTRTPPNGKSHRVPSKDVSHVKYWGEAAEFDPCIGGRELPVNRTDCNIPARRLGADRMAHRRLVRRTFRQAVAVQRTQLELQYLLLDQALGEQTKAPACPSVRWRAADHRDQPGFGHPVKPVLAHAIQPLAEQGRDEAFLHELATSMLGQCPVDFEGAGEHDRRCAAAMPGGDQTA